MLEFGCTGLRWAQRYRDLKAPRATALQHRQRSKGAGCDCEIFLNGWTLHREHQVNDPESEEYEVSRGASGLQRGESRFRPAMRYLDRPGIRALGLVSSRRQPPSWQFPASASVHVRPPVGNIL